MPVVAEVEESVVIVVAASSWGDAKPVTAEFTVSEAASMSRDAVPVAATLEWLVREAAASGGRGACCGQGRSGIDAWSGCTGRPRRLC